MFNKQISHVKITTFENGGYMSQTYTNDVLNGVSESYYPNGILQESKTYKKGKLNGTHIKMYENGKMRSCSEYNLDKCTSVKRWSYVGILQSDINYENKQKSNLDLALEGFSAVNTMIPYFC
jgi:antitoxin component YwqK of YwqJK toxin-antitoxin module